MIEDGSQPRTLGSGAVATGAIEIPDLPFQIRSSSLESLDAETESDEATQLRRLLGTFLL